MRSIYTITQVVCTFDPFNFSFWGLIVGLVTLFAGIILAYVFFKKSTKKSHDESTKILMKIDGIDPDTERMKFMD